MALAVVLVGLGGLVVGMTISAVFWHRHRDVHLHVDMEASDDRGVQDTDPGAR